MSRVILLCGSPLPGSLDWSEEDLSVALLPAFVEKRDLSGAADLKDTPPVWRSLDLVAPHLPTGLTQASGQEAHFGDPLLEIAASTSTAAFARDLTATNSVQSSPRSLDIDPTDAQSQILTQYYEHSFAMHDGLQSSQIVGVASTDNASFSTTVETDSFDSFISDAQSQKHVVDARLHSGTISDLKDIPNAGYLHSIEPQTMTVNLAVGVISVSQPRRILPRKGGRAVELVEMLVGDDTRAGFGINMWIAPAQAQDSNASRTHENNTLRDEVFQLRPRDVILARRVALGSFRSTVYGQSLRRGMTSLDLLYRNVIDAEDARGAFKAKDLDANIDVSDQLAKVKRVQDWVVRFVGAGPVTLKAKKDSHEISKEATRPPLPLDTP